MTHHKLYLSALILGLLPFACLQASPLALEQYLQQVKEKNEGVQALIQKVEAGKLRKEEASLLVKPQFFSNLTFYSDAKPTAAPVFQGTKTMVDTYNFGISQQTPFGLSGKLFYQWTWTRIEGANPQFLNPARFYEAKPVLELSQSLLKNGFGSETRSNVQVVESGTLAQTYAEAFKLKIALVEAEGVFWRLAAARQMVEVQKESLERAKRLRDWNRKRVKRGLADPSDELQAEANLQVRTLEYEASVNEMESASRKFNSFRGTSESKVSEELPRFDQKTTAQLKNISQYQPRLDVKAAQELTKVAEAQAQLGKERNTPTLDLFGSLATNGRTPEFSSAFSDSFTTQYPTFTVGLKFQTALDVGQVLDNRRAYSNELKAAELEYRRKAFEGEREFEDLTRRFQQAKDRLQLSFNIETVQKKKLERERQRLKVGRSVTYQVILFEQDFAAAELLRLKTQAEVLGLHAQLKLYEESL